MLVDSLGTQDMQLVEELSSDSKDSSIVVVGTADIALVRWLRHLGTPELLTWSEASRAPAVIRRARREALLRRCEAELDGIAQGVAARSAIHVLLDSVRPDHDQIRSVGDLAKKVRCGTRTLRGQGIRWSHAVRSARLARAVRIRRDEGRGWDHVALRLGYAGVAGLSELSRRAVGDGVRNLDARRWEDLLDLLKQCVSVPRPDS